MKVEFDQMPEESRLWIYQAERKFTEAEISTISSILTSFTQEWAAHGHPLKSSFRIEYDQFIILAVDESFNGASGCSIDGSTRVVRQLEDVLKTKLMDRTLVAFLKNEEVITVKISELGMSLQNGIWNKHTKTFNNLVPTKSKLEKEWIVEAQDSWLKKYLTKVTAF